MWELWFGKLKDGTELHPLIHAAAAKSREEGVVLRPMRKRDMEAEVGRFMEVYNEAWGHNWGFVPITEAEVRFQAKNLKPVLDENWAMMAEKDGEIVGAALTLPDVEQALAKMNGRLLPFGWIHFLRRKRYIDRLRVFALGVKDDYQHLGVAAALYERHVRDGGQRRPPRRPYGLDPRDQRPDEPGDGGDGRQRRPEVPDLRARAGRDRRWLRLTRL